MAEVTRVAHIGIVVRDTERALAFFSGGLGLEPRRVEIFEAARVKMTFVPIGETLLEFLEPLPGCEGDIADFLAHHGEGIHHLCFDTPDIVGALSHLRERGVALADEVPRAGALGATIAFVDQLATSGIVVELSEGQRDQDLAQ